MTGGRDPKSEASLAAVFTWDAVRREKDAA